LNTGPFFLHPRFAEWAVPVSHHPFWVSKALFLSSKKSEAFQKKNETPAGVSISESQMHALPMILDDYHKGEKI